MNYIKQLQLDNQVLQDDVIRLQDLIEDLRVYVSHPKFTECGGDLEGYVNVQDILNRTVIQNEPTCVGMGNGIL